MKFRKNMFLVLIFFIVILSFGCAGMQSLNSATVELGGTPTTGYTWVYTMSPEGIVREVSNEYVPDKPILAGSGGKFFFTFEAINKGVAELVFSYLRQWEEDIPPIQTVVYRAIVDGENNLTLAKK